MRKFYSFLLLLLVSLNIHSQATDFITGLNNPHDMVLDGHILYIAESDASRIIKVDLSLPNPEPEVVISGIPVTRGLALKGSELYFSQLNGENRISKINLLDPNPTPSVVLENFISAMDLEFHGNDLYIAQFALNRIVKIDPRIPNPPVVEVINGFQTPYALELVGNVLYVANWIGNKVAKIDLTNPNPIAVDVITNLSLPVGLKHRRNEMYIAEAGQRIGEDRISKIDISISNPVREDVATGLYNPTQGLEIYNDVLYIAEDFKISKVELPALSVNNPDLEKIVAYPNPTSDFIQISGLRNLVDYAIYSISGGILRTGVVEKNQKIDVQNLVDGTYFLILDSTEVIKFVKE